MASGERGEIRRIEAGAPADRARHIAELPGLACQRPIFETRGGAFDIAKASPLGDQSEQAELQRIALGHRPGRWRLSGLVIDDGEVAAGETVDAIGLPAELHPGNLDLAPCLGGDRKAAVAAILLDLGG